MNNKVLVVAPHPDDELLGCGGTLLRKKAEGSQLCWVIVTNVSVEEGWDVERVKSRNKEIDAVAQKIGFDAVYNLNLPPAKLDILPLGMLIDRMSEVFKEYQPNELYIPHYSDVHTDHGIVFNMAAACSKWFRYRSVKRVLCYETLSETEFGLRSEKMFRPNVYMDISEYLEDKIEALSIYKTEIGDFPFPRSEKAIRALATIRGATAGYDSAEAFQLINERI